MEESWLTMAHKDVFGRTIPTVNPGGVSDGPANIQTALEAFSATSGGMINVASDAEANSIAAAAPEGTSFPLHFWNTTKGAHLVKETRTTPLEQVGGKDHGAELLIGSDEPYGSGYLMPIKNVQRASEGWQVDPTDRYLTVPEPGMYLINAQVRVGITSGSSSERIALGHCEFQINVGSINASPHNVLRGGTPQSEWQTVTAGVWLAGTTSDRLSFRLVYQGPSKTLDGRVFVAKLGTPRWV